jgi:hypothetical protein
MPSLRLPALAATAALALALAACGNDTPSAAPGAAGADPTSAQGGRLEGPVEAWAHGATTVWNEGSDQPVGRIDAEGRLRFSGADLRGRFGIVERLVPCDTADFAISNGEARFEPISLGVEHGRHAWRLGAGTSRAAAHWHGGHGPTPEPGSSSLQWVHVDGAVRIEGQCEAQMAAGDMMRPVLQRTEYRIALVPGWNLLRHTFVEVTTGADGHSYPLHIRIDVLDRVPEGVAWYPEET